MTKDISSAVVVSPNLNKTTQDIGNVLLDETNKEVKNTLSGERIHGLPNETLTGKKLQKDLNNNSPHLGYRLHSK